jgi:hypothetical protein
MKSKGFNMKLSIITMLAVFSTGGLWAQKATNPLEDHTSYDAYSKDSETRKRQEDLKSIGRGDPKVRMEAAMSELKSADADIEKLRELSTELKTAIANSDSSVLTKANMKRTDELEKLAKNIRAKMKRAAAMAQLD